MARIKIKDLPEGKKISKEDMQRIFGGPARRVEAFEGPFSTLSESETTDTLIDPIDPNLEYFNK